MSLTLLHAVEVLTKDDVPRDALGSVPDGDYMDYYAEVEREEFFDYHRAVTDCEIGRYLTLM